MSIPKLFYFCARKRAVVLLTVGLVSLTHTLTASPSPKVMRLAHVYQLDSPSGIGLQAFAEKVAEYSQGRIEMKVFPAGQLGSNRNIYISTKTGGIDFCVPNFPMLSDIVPEMTIMTSGYLFDNFDQIERVMAHPKLGQKWNEEIIEKCHIRILGSYYYGKRVVTTGEKPFKSPDEMKGLKIRAVPNPMSLAVIRGLGGNPTPMPLKEIFIGLSQGIIDGQENPYPTIWSNKWYEVQKYVLETNHQLNAIPFAISERSWKSLSLEDRAAVEKASKEAMDIMSALTRQFENEIAEKLQAKGMIIVPYSELDIDAFKQSVRESIKSKFDGKVWRRGLMEEVLAAGKE